MSTKILFTALEYIKISKIDVFIFCDILITGFQWLNLNKLDTCNYFILKIYFLVDHILVIPFQIIYIKIV